MGFQPSGNLSYWIQFRRVSAGIPIFSPIVVLKIPNAIAISPLATFAWILVSGPASFSRRNRVLAMSSKPTRYAASSPLAFLASTSSDVGLMSLNRASTSAGSTWIGAYFSPFGVLWWTRLASCSTLLCLPISYNEIPRPNLNKMIR